MSSSTFFIMSLLYCCLFLILIYIGYLIVYKGSQKNLAFSPHLLVFERKLDVALRDTHAISFVNRIKKGEASKDDLLLKYACDNIGVSLFEQKLKINTNLFPHLFLAACKIPHLSFRKSTYKRILHLMRSALQIQLQWNMQYVSDKLKANIPRYMNNWIDRAARSPLLVRLNFLLEPMDNLINSLPHSELPKGRDEEETTYLVRKASRCYDKIKLLNMKIAWSRNSCVIVWNNCVYFLPREYLLLIHNKLCDILSVLMFSASITDSMYGCVDVLPKVEDFITEYAILAAKFDQQFFNLSKVLEALIIGETLIKHEGTRNSAFMKTLAEGLLETNNFDYMSSHLREVVLSCSDSLRHELSCLSKIMGHPFCNIKSGAERLFEKTQEVTNISAQHMTQAVLYAKENLIRNFILKFGRWPVVILQHGASQALVQALMRNVDPRNSKIVRDFGLVNLIDYEMVTIGQNAEFEYIDNFIPYIKDRSISLLRSEVLQKYIYHNPLFKNDIKKIRLLLFYLLFPQHTTDHLMYLQEYIAGDFQALSDYLVIKLVPKEKEHKLEPRFFGCKSHQDRARSIIQEENAAIFMDDLSDEQAMTLSEIKLIKKLYAFRNLDKAYPGYRKLIINIDASSWNNRFRHAAVAPIMASTLDNYFNCPIFSTTHRAYQNSLVYAPDTEDVYHWNGQEGGIEGLNQYTWVLTYIQHMKVCMQDYPFPYHLLCKGDDLRICVMIPPQYLINNTLDNLRRQVMTSISRVGKSFGHVIKVEDSYASECYFAFSKNTFLHDVEMPQTFRKIQKCYGANNAFMSTVDDYIAASFSNAHSASKTSPSPIPCFLVACFWMFHSLSYSTYYKNISDDEMLALTIIPNLLGGLPIIYLHNFFVRAESDLLVPCIDLLGFLSKFYQEIFMLAARFFVQPVTSAKDSVRGFMIDPYSLPLRKPTGAQPFLRQVVATEIKKRTRNEMLQELYEAQEMGFADSFSKMIMSANIWNGKLISALYDCTPEGILSELLRKFESGRSVYNAIVLNSSKSYANRVLRQANAKDKYLNHYRLQIMRADIDSSKRLLAADWKRKCPTEVASEIRSCLWGKNIEGVTQPNMQHQLLIGDIESFQNENHATENHFEIFLDPPNSSIKAPLFSKGKFPPFLGGSTGRGLALPETHFIAHNILSSSIHKLLDLLKWASMTKIEGNNMMVSNLPEIIIPLIEAYSKRPIRDLAPFAGHRVEARTTHHHVRTGPYKASIMPNTLLNVYTRVKGNSYSHLFLESSIAHYKINFLHTFCHTVSIWAFPLWMGQNSTSHERIWAETRDCNFCMEPLAETPMILAYTRLPRITFNSITQIGASALRRILAELDAYEAPQYYQPAGGAMNITIEQAQAGLVQSMINTMWRERSAIQVRYTQHHLTSAGFAAMRDWTIKGSTPVANFRDLTNVPMGVVFEHSSILVFGHILKTLHTAEPETILTQLGVIPAEELPWTTLLVEIHQVGRLYELQSYLRHQYPATSSSMYDNPNSYSIIYGACCYWRCTSGRTQSSLAYLSPLVQDTFVNTLRSRMEGLRWYHIYKECITLYKALRDNPDPVLRRDTTIYMIIGCMALSSEELLRGIRVGTFRDITSITVQLFTYEGDIAETSELWEDQTEWTDELVMLRNRYPQLQWTQVLKMLADAEPDVITQANHIMTVLGTIQVTIFKSDEVTCLNRVRQALEDGDIPRLYTAYNRGPVIPHLRPHRQQTVRVQVFERTYPPGDMLLQNLPYNVVREHQINDMDQKWIKRPVGMSNLSMSKLLSLFSQLRIYNLPDRGIYVGFGDGYGGFTAVMCAMTSESILYYNTMPNSAESNPSPTVAQEIARHRNNTVDKHLISRGLYDLRSECTFLELEIHTGNPTLITCDAEVDDITSPGRCLLLTNVAIYFLRSGVRYSVLILKMYAGERHSIMLLIALLRPACREVFLVMSEASSNDGELYLVAQLQDSVFLPYNSLVNMYPPGPIVVRVTRFLDLYDNNVRHDITGTNIVRGIWNYEVRLLPVIRILPLFGWSKLQDVTKITLSHPTVGHRSGQNRVDWLNILTRLLTSQINVLRDELNRNYIGHNPAAYDTLAHSYLIMNRYLIAQGFLYVISQSLIIWPFHITTDQSRQAFTNLLNTFPHPLGLNPVQPNFFLGPLLRNNYQINPYHSWSTGLKWGVSSIFMGHEL